MLHSVEQGAQPSFGEVRVGIVYVGHREGILSVRLQIRSDTQLAVVDLREGESFEAFGLGVITARNLSPRTAEGRGRLDLEWKGCG